MNSHVLPVHAVAVHENVSRLSMPFRTLWLTSSSSAVYNSVCNAYASALPMYDVYIQNMVLIRMWRQFMLCTPRSPCQTRAWASRNSGRLGNVSTPQVTKLFFHLGEPRGYPRYIRVASISSFLELYFLFENCCISLLDVVPWGYELRLGLGGYKADRPQRIRIRGMHFVE